MKKDNQLRLLNVMRTSCSIENLNRTCQAIIIDELEDILEGAERKKNIKKLCARIVFPIKVQKNEFSAKALKLKPVNTIIPFIVCIGCYWLVYSLLHLHLVSAVISILAAYLFNRKNNGAIKAMDEGCNLTILSTLEEFEKEIDSIVSILSKERSLFIEEQDSSMSVSYPFDRQYKDVLEFLQRQYSKCINTETVDLDRLKEIEELFEDCGYKLIQYSKDYSDCFYSTKANGIVEVKTTKPAVMNKNTEFCVLKGNVVFPK